MCGPYTQSLSSKMWVARTSLTIMYVLASVAVQPPGVNLLHILPKLQHPPHAGSPVGTPLCKAILSTRRGTGACCIALCVVCKARAVSLECTQLHAVCAQLPRPATLALAAAFFARLQLPLEQRLLLRKLILCQALVPPGHRTIMTQHNGQFRWSMKRILEAPLKQLQNLGAWLALLGCKDMYRKA